MVNKTRSPAQPFPDLAIDRRSGRAAAVAAGRDRTYRRSSRGRRPTGARCSKARTATTIAESARRSRRGGRGSRGVGRADRAQGARADDLRAAVRVRPLHPRRGRRPLRPRDRRRLPRATTASSRPSSWSPRSRCTSRSARTSSPRTRSPTARARLNRLEHNPDALLGEVEFDSAEERTQAVALAAEKAALVVGDRRARRRQEGARRSDPRGERGAGASCWRHSRAGMEAEVGALEAQLRRLGDPHRPHLPVLLLVAARGRRQGAVADRAAYVRDRDPRTHESCADCRMACRRVRIARMAEEPLRCERMTPCLYLLLMRISAPRAVSASMSARAAATTSRTSLA